MKYQLNIVFDEGIPREKIEYLLSSLNWRKKLDTVGETYTVDNATLNVADEEPDWDEDEDVLPDGETSFFGLH